MQPGEYVEEEAEAEEEEEEEEEERRRRRRIVGRRGRRGRRGRGPLRHTRAGHEELLDPRLNQRVGGLSLTLLGPFLL